MLTHFLSTRCLRLAGLLLLAGIALAPAVWATPAHTFPAAQSGSTLASDPAQTDAPSDSPANDMIGMHHPRSDLGGSFSLNTPARPGFWVATGFTGLVGVAWLITLVRFRPGTPR